MSCREGVDVQGDAVQEAWRHLPGSSALHQSLDSSNSHDIKDEGCELKEFLFTCYNLDNVTGESSINTFNLSTNTTL